MPAQISPTSDPHQITALSYDFNPDRAGPSGVSPRLVACFSDGGVINKIPAARLSPQGMALLRAFPLPTGLLGGNNNWQDVRANPNDLNANMNLARLFLHQRNWGQARLQLETILSIDPDNAAAKQVLARLQEEMEKKR